MISKWNLSFKLFSSNSWNLKVIGSKKGQWLATLISKKTTLLAPISFKVGSRAFKSSLIPAKTTCMPPLKFAHHTFLVLWHKLKRLSSETPKTTIMDASLFAHASCIILPLWCVSLRAFSKSSAPLKDTALTSPSECPKAKTGFNPPLTCLLSNW